MSDHIKTGVEIWGDIERAKIKKRLFLDGEQWVSLSWLKEQIQGMIDGEIISKEEGHLSDLHWVLSLLNDKEPLKK